VRALARHVGQLRRYHQYDRSGNLENIPYFLFLLYAHLVHYHLHLHDEVVQLAAWAQHRNGHLGTRLAAACDLECLVVAHVAALVLQIAADAFCHQWKLNLLAYNLLDTPSRNLHADCPNPCSLE